MVRVSAEFKARIKVSMEIAKTKMTKHDQKAPSAVTSTSAASSNQSWTTAQYEHDLNEQLKYLRQRLCEAPREVDMMMPFIYGIYDIMRQQKRQLDNADPEVVLHSITDPHARNYIYLKYH